MMLVLFMEYRRKAVYTAKARIGFWGMFLVGVFLIVKAKSTGMSVGLMEEITPPKVNSSIPFLYSFTIRNSLHFPLR